MLNNLTLHLQVNHGRMGHMHGPVVLAASFPSLAYALPLETTSRLLKSQGRTTSQLMLCATTLLDAARLLIWHADGATSPENTS